MERVLMQYQQYDRLWSGALRNLSREFNQRRHIWQDIVEEGASASATSTSDFCHFVIAGIMVFHEQIANFC